jgi:5-methylthioadenosine/S-adenosylhomocysteine deaminase
MSAREPADLIVHGGTVMTVDPERRILLDGAVAVRADRIAGVGKSGDLLARFAPARRIDATDKLVMRMHRRES